jgi:hypothetical protein
MSKSETFESLVKELLPTSENPLLISKEFMGVPVFQFKIEFNPEDFNFFPSMVVRDLRGNSIWYSEDSPYFSEDDLLFDLEGLSRAYYNGDGKADDNAIERAQMLLEDLKGMIKRLEDLNDLKGQWITFCGIYGFGSKIS